MTTARAAACSRPRAPDETAVREALILALALPGAEEAIIPRPPSSVFPVAGRGRQPEHWSFARASDLPVSPLDRPWRGSPGPARPPSPILKAENRLGCPVGAGRRP